MKTYTCDKCGECMGQFPDTDKVVIPPKRSEYIRGVRHSYCEEKLDLCDACIADLRVWITGVEE